MWFPRMGKEGEEEFCVRAQADPVKDLWRLWVRAAGAGGSSTFKH